MDASTATPSAYNANPVPPINTQHPAVAYPSSAATPKTTSLNERLNTNYVDIGEEEDSWNAQITKSITGFVGQFITPRQLLIVLRVLKAITFCFLILTLAADLLYIVFLEVLADREVKDLAGGRRDFIIRVYGLFLAVVALCIELDYSLAVKSFYGFKGYIPRALLLFFISAITGAHPLHAAEEANGDDEVYYDDDAAYNNINSAAKIPGSAVVFQMVTSFILGLCAITYFVFGCLCFDKFTSRAFLSVNDPLVTTAIQMPNSTKAGEKANVGTYQSPEP